MFVVMKKSFFIFFLLIGFSVFSWGQKTISFLSTDSLEVTADLYETFEESHRYMLMFHQAEYSRGEYSQIAARIIKLDMNCVAVDLRYGNEVNFINNETAMRAKQTNKPSFMIDCENDIIGAINYIYSIDSTAKIFLMGSSFSASLCLKVAKDRDDIQAVIAYSPGEFFGELNIGRYITGLTTPTYIGCPQSEYSYVSLLAAGVEAPKTVVFHPENGDGQHGAKTLWWESDTCEEFWLSLLFFLKDFK